MLSRRLAFRASAETAAVILFAAAATGTGLRTVLVQAGARAPSAEVVALASWSTAGLAVGAAVLLFAQVVGHATGWSSARGAIRRLPTSFCLVAVVVLGAVTLGGGAVRDEAVLTFILAAQLLMLAMALVPFALVGDARGATRGPGAPHRTG